MLALVFLSACSTSNDATTPFPDIPDDDLDAYVSDPADDEAEEMVPMEKIRAVAESAGVEFTRATYIDMVPFDEDGDNDFLLVWGITEVLPDGSLDETYIDPYTAEVLAQEPPHAGLMAHIVDIGADRIVAWGSSADTYESFPWGWQLPFESATGVMTQGYNRGTHTGSINYSTDWDPGSCGFDVAAPSSGWVMNNSYLSGWGYQTVVAGNCASGTCTSGGWGTRYLWRLAHFQATALVTPGWWIEQGRQVGDMGTTGTSTGCHIHMTAYRGTYTGSGNISGSALPIEDWPASGDSICGGDLASYNFSDATSDSVTTDSSGCP